MSIAVPFSKNLMKIISSTRCSSLSSKSFIFLTLPFSPLSLLSFSFLLLFFSPLTNGNSEKVQAKVKTLSKITMERKKSSYRPKKEFASCRYFSIPSQTVLITNAHISCILIYAWYFQFNSQTRSFVIGVHQVLQQYRPFFNDGSYAVSI